MVKVRVMVVVRVCKSDPSTVLPVRLNSGSEIALVLVDLVMEG